MEGMTVDIEIQYSIAWQSLQTVPKVESCEIYTTGSACILSRHHCSYSLARESNLFPHKGPFFEFFGEVFTWGASMAGLLINHI